MQLRVTGPLAGPKNWSHGAAEARRKLSVKIITRRQIMRKIDPVTPGELLKEEGVDGVVIGTT